MQRFSEVLFVVSPQGEDDAAFRRALRVAEGNQARLTVMDVRAGPPVPPAHAPAGVTGESLRAAIVEASREQLQAYTAAAEGRVEVRTCTEFGVDFVEIVRAVLRQGHDLVVKAARPPSGRHGAFGSLDMHLLRKCPAPGYRRVLATLDFDPDRPVQSGDSLNRRILEAAAAQALADFAELHVAHAWQPAFEGILRSRGVFGNEHEAQRYVEAEQVNHQAGLRRLLDQLREWIGGEAWDYLQPHAHLRQGAAGEVIPALAGELHADLVVMGTVGRTGISGLLIGNTAETILDGLSGSVLAVKPPGFRTPVEADG
jgi:nucleotide-binding universal stress UspA family protein